MIMRDRAAVLTSFGAGLGLMYFLDPDRGRRRRALMRDQMAHAARITSDAAGTIGRDAAHRTSGAVATLRGSLRRGQVDDEVVTERVRAQLGRVVSHPHAVAVATEDGIVTVRGPILQHEADRLLRTIGRVAGVRDVVNDLEEHEEAADVPSLQGGSTAQPRRPDILQRQWSPATRVVTGSSGLALATYGLSRRTVPGVLVAAAGIGLLTRAATNLDVRRLTGIGAKRRAVEIQKTITIDAPVDEVFAFWTMYENFPRFMSRVLDVRPGAREQQSHWRVAGPAGLPVEFDAEISAFVPNEAFGWRTIEGSPIAHAGLVRFEPAGDGRTRVQIRMSYNPIAGWLGHGIAVAFGVDPKSSFDADLVRMKTLIETGRPPRDASQRVTH